METESTSESSRCLNESGTAMTHNRTTRRITATVILLTPVIWYASATEVQATVIRIKAQTEVSTAIVRLRDVADVSEADAPLIERLGALTLMPAPAAGRRTQIDFATIRSRLRAQGVDLANIRFTGRSSVLVTTSAPVATDKSNAINASFTKRKETRIASWQISRAERNLKEAVTQYVKRRLPGIGGFTVETRVDPGNVPTILSAVGSGYAVTGGRAPWDAWQQLTIRFLDRKEVLHEVQVRSRVSINPYVVALRFTVPRGHLIKLNDLVWRQVSTAQTALTRMEDVVGRETKRSLRKDEAVKADDIRQVPLVRSNDIVTVYSRRGGITVKRHFKSRSDGVLGDTITVVSLGAGRQTMLARVTGYHEAEVFGSAKASGKAGISQNRNVTFLPTAPVARSPQSMGRFGNARKVVTRPGASRRPDERERSTNSSVGILGGR